MEYYNKKTSDIQQLVDIPLSVGVWTAISQYR